MFVFANAQNRHDPRMIKPTGDLSLPEKSPAAHRVGAERSMHLLQGDPACELFVMSDQDFAKTSSGVRFYDTVTSGR